MSSKNVLTAIKDKIRVRLRNSIKCIEKYVSASLGNLLWSPVSVSVFARDGEKILVLENDGKYCLPGGLNTGGEKLKATGRREVLEETGCVVKLGNLLDISHDNGRASGLHFFFEAEVEQKDLGGSWEGNPEFVDGEKLEELDWELHHSHVHEYLFPND